MPFLDEVDDIKAKAAAGGAGTALRVGIIASAVLVAVVAAFVFTSSAGGGFSVEKAPSSSSAAREEIEAGEDGEASAATCWVYIVGAVQQPGVYEMPVDARVNDVLAEAGGLAPDADPAAVNLARPLVDGEQIRIPTLEETAAAVPATGGAEQGFAPAQASALSGITADGKVNINTASSQELQTLPGVGEATAQKIVDFREAEGPFSAPEDLKRVSGIGDKKYAALADSIAV